MGKTSEQEKTNAERAVGGKEWKSEKRERERERERGGSDLQLVASNSATSLDLGSFSRYPDGLGQKQTSLGGQTPKGGAGSKRSTSRHFQDFSRYSLRNAIPKPPKTRITQSSWDRLGPLPGNYFRKRSGK